MLKVKNRVLWSVGPGKEWIGAAAQFSVRMMIAATLSLAVLCFVLVIVVRLDVAFFEANGMMATDEIREAFYYQVFDPDFTVAGMLLLGFTAVAVVSFLYSKSQFDCFRRLAEGFEVFARGDGIPSTARMGRFGPYAWRFFVYIQNRFEREPQAKLDAILAEARAGWPTRPAVSWRDLAQFSAVSCGLGIFFSVCCAMIYLRVSSRVVDLSGQLMHFQSSSGPAFLEAQFNIIGIVARLLLLVTVVGFLVIGYRFALMVGQADYAVLRDLRGFMEGNLSQRLTLRTDDPARGFLPPMNAALDEISRKLVK